MDESVGKIYFDPDDELMDGRGWVVADANSIALRFETFGEATDRAFEVHPDCTAFMVDMYGLIGGVLVKAGEWGFVLMATPLDPAEIPLRDFNLSS